MDSKIEIDRMKTRGAMVRWGVGVSLAFISLASHGATTNTYSISGTNILQNGSPWYGGGIDALDQFGPGTKSGRNIEVVREVIDDVTNCPILSSTGTIDTPIGYLHPLQDVVNNNRTQGQVTILAMFGWDTGGYEQILGNTPSSMPWYSTFKTRLAAIAQTFTNQPDVWIDVWNEPYSWNNTNFTDAQWVSDMTDLYNTIRNTGNTNIILIPGQAEDGQETVLLNEPSFLTGKSNVLAEIHCYNGWTGHSQANSEERIQSIRTAGWALIFGEVGEDNYVTNCTYLLNATVTQKAPSLGWSWSANDGSEVVSNGVATAWGSVFFPYLPRTVALPGPWSETDIGAVPITGGSSYSSGVYTVTGSGADIWNTVDAFDFVYQPVTASSQPVAGNGVVIAKVAAIQDVNAWSKAGVMVRGDLSPGAVFADVVVTPGNGVNFDWRATYGNQCGAIQASGLTAPLWVMLAWTATNNFTASYSSNGANWTTMGSTNITALGNEAFAGLAVTSYSSSQECMATFDNVAVNPSLTNASITNVALAGANLVVKGVNNNIPNASYKYVVLGSTNLAFPLSSWTIMATNSFNSDGTFDCTNAILQGAPQRFLEVKVVP